MAVSKRTKVWVATIPLLLAGYWFINNFVYPFFPESPNYSDVERVFSRMQFPAEWEEIDSSENRGLHGRACPIEPGPRCFSKGIRFKIPEETKYKDVEAIFQQTECQNVSVQKNEPIGGVPYANFGCSVEGLRIDGGVIEENDSWEASFYVST